MVIKREACIFFTHPLTLFYFFKMACISAKSLGNTFLVNWKGNNKYKVFFFLLYISRNIFFAAYKYSCKKNFSLQSFLINKKQITV